MKLLLLTGMSGSGKNTAFKNLEDFGYNCVDNLPVALLKSFVNLAYSEKNTSSKIAVGIDIRSGDKICELKGILDELDADGKSMDILFLDASDDVLVKRYKETRRLHPLSPSDSIQSGIKQERQEISFLKDRATYIIDTTQLLTRELRAEMQRIFVDEAEYKSLFINVMSFGFKYGIPQDADLVFDVRFLPNPYYNPEMRPFTGNDDIIRDFVMEAPEAGEFLDKLEDMIQFLIPNYISEGKNSLVICIGCTGGKHRSVTLANELHKRLKKDDSYGLKIEHRDIGKDALRGK